MVLVRDASHATREYRKESIAERAKKIAPGTNVLLHISAQCGWLLAQTWLILKLCIPAKIDIQYT